MTDGGFSVVLVGAGHMGSAMMLGWISDGFPTASITVIDPSPVEIAATTIAELGIRHETDIPQDLAGDVVLVALKPQIMDKVLPRLAPLMGKNSVAVSVAAGTTLAGISAGLGDVAVVRTMPNTPAQVRRGITVCVGNGKVTSQHRKNVTNLLESIGAVEWIDDEALIDAVTGVSGSGPAYVFYLAEALSEAGVAAGLPVELAQKLARHTVCGAGELMHQSPLEPSDLRKNVTSPNGTTQAALEVLMDEEGLSELLTRAVAAATLRSRELAG